MTAKCRKCGRPLKDPRSTKRGHGPVCWGGVQAELEAERKTVEESKETITTVGAITRASGARSDFTYHIRKTHDGKDVLVIVDLNRGGMSVTNNVENVVRSIATTLGEKTLTMPIVYRDSTGRYDGIDGAKLNDFPFYGIGASDEDSAVEKATIRANFT